MPPRRDAIYSLSNHFMNERHTTDWCSLNRSEVERQTLFQERDQICEDIAEAFDGVCDRMDWSRVLFEATRRHRILNHEPSRNTFVAEIDLCGLCIRAAVLMREDAGQWEETPSGIPKEPMSWR